MNLYDVNLEMYRKRKCVHIFISKKYKKKLENSYYKHFEVKFLLNNGIELET